MPDTYHTIKAMSKGLYKEKGSKFLSFAYPLTSQNDSARHMDELKREFHDARHHCFAYRFGAGGEHFRANDDNEPAYTAGKPILGQIDSMELTNVMVAVVRYFGGTLLGKGGLITAYKNAAHNALLNAEIIEKTIQDHYRITCNYEEVSIVLKLLKEIGNEPVKQEFDLTCNLHVALNKGESDRLLDKINLIEHTKVEYLYTDK